MNNGNGTSTLLLPGGVLHRDKLLAPADRSPKGRCVLVARLDRAVAAANAHDASIHDGAPSRRAAS
jgi:hypothetical protein